jgi:hemerythrin-like metal-binding protein
MIKDATYLRDLGGVKKANMLMERKTMPVVAGTFRWTNAYCVNVAVLDEQHQRLFDTVNELDLALRTGQGNSVLNPVLEKLVDYALRHFTAEESLMAEHDFPGLSTHRTQHEMFRRKIAVFLEDHKAAKPGVPVFLMLFMQNWLKQHVLKTDKQYSAFLNARGVH